MRSRAFTGPYEGRGPKDRAAQLAFISVLPCDCKQRKKKVSIDKWRINFKSLDALLAFVWLSVNDC